MYFIYEGATNKLIGQDGFAYSKPQVLYNPMLPIVFCELQEAYTFITENKRWTHMAVSPMEVGRLAHRWGCKIEGQYKLVRDYRTIGAPPDVVGYNVAEHVLHTQPGVIIGYRDATARKQAATRYCEAHGLDPQLHVSEPTKWRREK